MSLGIEVRMYRLGKIVEEREVEHLHPAVFQMPDPDATRQRIVAGVPNSNPDIFLRLARCLQEPLFLLYILHTCRGEAEPGRYRSPELSAQDIEEFVNEFRPFLSADGRFDLWAYSPEQRATVAWDRHNLLYGYGPIECYAWELKAAGFEPGTPKEPSPHTHHYRSELDPLAEQLIRRYEWLYSPLRPEDEQ